MAVEWKRSPNYTWPDDSVTINTIQSTDDKCVVDVPQGAACGQYWVLYKNIDNGTTCTGETYFTVTGDCGGGPTPTPCSVTRVENIDVAGGTKTIGYLPTDKQDCDGWDFEVEEGVTWISNVHQEGRNIVGTLASNQGASTSPRTGHVLVNCYGECCGECADVIQQFAVTQNGSYVPPTNVYTQLLRDVANTCTDTAQGCGSSTFDSSYTGHCNQGTAYVTFIIKNDTTLTIPYNGNFQFSTSEPVATNDYECYYREPSSFSETGNDAHFRYCTETNRLLRPTETITFQAPIIRYCKKFDGFDYRSMEGKVPTSYKMYMSVAESKDGEKKIGNSSQYTLVKTSGPSTITPNATYELSITGMVLPQFAFDADDIEAGYSHSNPGETLRAVPLNIGDWK